MPIDIAVKGLIETQRNLEQAAADLHGEPMLKAMREATLLVERDAKRLAPVDRGGLRQSISSEVRVESVNGHADSVTGVVGSNKTYAAAVELGSKPHFPPISAIEAWAERRGLNAFLVARAISRRGTLPRRFLQGAFDKNKPLILRKIGEGVSGIVQKANQ